MAVVELNDVHEWNGEHQAFEALSDLNSMRINNLTNAKWWKETTVNVQYTFFPFSKSRYFHHIKHAIQSSFGFGIEAFVWALLRSVLARFRLCSSYHPCAICTVALNSIIPQSGKRIIQLIILILQRPSPSPNDSIPENGGFLPCNYFCTTTETQLKHFMDFTFSGQLVDETHWFTGAV